MQGLGAYRKAQLDVGEDSVGVECAVEGAELDGVRRALRGEGGVEVEQVVAAGVVVRPGTLPPVGATAAAVPVPELCQLLEGVGLLAVDRREEAGLYGLAPAVAPRRVNAQRLCQQVFLGVDDVDQPPQAGRGVLPEADVYVDTAGVVGTRPRRPDSLGDREYHRDVLPAAHRADHLGAGVGDRAVALDRPVPPVRHGHTPVVEVPPPVDSGRAEVGGDGLGGTLPPEAVGFELDTESLGTHGVFLLRPAACPARGVPGVPPGATIHHSGRRKKQPDEKHKEFLAVLSKKYPRRRSRGKASYIRAKGRFRGFPRGSRPGGKLFFARRPVARPGVAAPGSRPARIQVRAEPVTRRADSAPPPPRVAPPG